MGLALYDEQKPDRAFALTASGASDGRSLEDIAAHELMCGFGEPKLLDGPAR